MKPSTNRPSRTPLLAVLALALGVRVVHAAGVAVISDDTRLYALLAKHMGAWTAEGWRRALAHPYHPGTSFLMAVLRPVFGTYDAAGAAVSVLLGTLTVLVMYRLVREALGTRAALLCALLLATLPAHVSSSGEALSEGPYFFFWMLALLLLFLGLRGGRLLIPGPEPPAGASTGGGVPPPADNRPPAIGGGTLPAFLGGMSSGAAYLFRPEGMSAVMVAVALAMVLGPKGRSWRGCFLLMLAMVLGFALPAAPYMVSIGGITGKVSNATENFTGVRSAREDAAKAARRIQKTAPNQAIDPFVPAPRPPAPIGVPTAAARLLNRLFRSLAYGPAVLVFLGMLVSLRGGFCRQGPAWGSLLALLGAAFALLFLILVRVQAVKGYVSGRHVEGLALLALPLAVPGARALGAALAAVFPRLGARGATAALVGLMVVVMGAVSARPSRLDKRGAIEAGRIIRERFTEGQRVRMLYTPRALRSAYYAGVYNPPLMWTPRATLPGWEIQPGQLVPTMRRHGWEYLVMTWTDLHHPRRASFANFAPLLESSAFQPVARTSEWEALGARPPGDGFQGRFHVAIFRLPPLGENARIPGVPNSRPRRESEPP